MKKASLKKKVRTIKAWGGFFNNKLDCETFEGGTHILDLIKQFNIYKTKSQAQGYYEDVRPIKITY